MPLRSRVSRGCQAPTQTPDELSITDAGVSILGLSTYETDYVFVKQADFERSLAALRQAGYQVTTEPATKR
jgi:hypothetical protein